MFNIELHRITFHSYLSGQYYSALCDKIKMLNNLRSNQQFFQNEAAQTTLMSVIRMEN